MLKIGITGGIGSGKTTVCKVFELLGVPIFYADDAAKVVMTDDKLLIQQIESEFGEDSYNPEGKLNRKYIADIVFKDTHKLEKLNAIVHPAVFRVFDSWLLRHIGAKYILKEAALLFESGSYKLCDRSLLVTAPESLRIKRVIERDKVSAIDVQMRIDKQFSEETRLKMADYQINNDETQLVIPQVIKIHSEFLVMADAAV